MLAGKLQCQYGRAPSAHYIRTLVYQEIFIMKKSTTDMWHRPEADPATQMRLSRSPPPTPRMVPTTTSTDFPTVFDHNTCVRKGLCPVTVLQGQQSPFESHSLYFGGSRVHHCGYFRLLMYPQNNMEPDRIRLSSLWGESRAERRRNRLIGSNRQDEYDYVWLGHASRPFCQDAFCPCV